MLSILCPQCSNVNPLLDGLAGKRIRCKQCSLLLEVPDPARSQEGLRPSLQPTKATPGTSRREEKAPAGRSEGRSAGRARGSRSSKVSLKGQRVAAMRDQASRGWAWMATAALLLGLIVGAYGVFLLVSRS